ncbi:hypothetical protein EDB80DRAFT_718154 [Ilyonectria destructans]|nr:hypothetical protein EDB80DRAFT_718154 [Ilyonectria destructans]
MTDSDVSGAGGAGGSLIAVISPPPSLHQLMSAQAKDFRTAWEALDGLRTINFSEDVGSHWDSQVNHKVAAKDVIKRLISSHTQLVARHYNTVERIMTMSLIQGTRSNSLAKGRISLQVVLKSTSTAISAARNQAALVNALIVQISPEITNKLERIKASIDQLKQTITDVGPATGGRESASRKKVVGTIAKACLTAFTTGILVSYAAFAASGGTDFESIPAVILVGTEKSNALTEKHIKTVQNAWNSFEVVLRTAPDPVAAAEIGTALFNKLSDEDLSVLLQILRISITFMERTAASLESAQKPLDELRSSIAKTSDVINDMHDRCLKYEQNLETTKPMSFDIQDAAVVAGKWDKVNESCQQWLDVVHEQGISPTEM